MADRLSNCATDEEDICYAEYWASSDSVGEYSRGQASKKCSQCGGGSDKFLKLPPGVSRRVRVIRYRRPKPSADWKGSRDQGLSQCSRGHQRRRRCHTLSHRIKMVDTVRKARLTEQETRYAATKHQQPNKPRRPLFTLSNKYKFRYFSSRDFLCDVVCQRLYVPFPDFHLSFLVVAFHEKV